MTRAQVCFWAFLCFTAPGAARAGDVLLSPKERASSIRLGDDSYIPGNGFPLGPLRLHPFLRQRADFDDNLFLEEEDPTWGLLWAGTGGIRVDLLPGNHEFTLGYKARGYVRVHTDGPDFADAASKEHYDSRVDGLTRIEHVVDSRNALLFPWGRFELLGNYEKLSDPLNFAFTRHIRRDRLSGALDTTVQWARFRFNAGAGIVRYDFHGAFDYVDNLQWNAFGEAGYQVAPKLNIVVDYGVCRILYDGMSAQEELLYGAHADVEMHTFTAGLRGYVTARMEFMAKAGALFQRVEGGAAPEEGGWSFFGKARVRLAASVRTSIEAGYLRDVQISQLSSSQIVDRAELKARHWMSPYVAGKMYTYVENTAPSKGKGFLRWAVGLELEYQMYAWLSMGVGYEYRERQTGIPGARFQNHRAWVHLTIGF